jgi:hypothetical protein
MHSCLQKGSAAVGRYFQSIRCGDTFVRDHEGVERLDVLAARRPALETLFDMAREPEVHGSVGRLRERAFIIMDESGKHVLTVPVSVVGHLRWTPVSALIFDNHVKSCLRPGRELGIWLPSALNVQMRPQPWHLVLFPKA